MDKTPKPLNADALAIAKSQLPMLTEKESKLQRSLLKVTMAVEEMRAKVKLSVLEQIKDCDRKTQEMLQGKEEEISRLEELRREVFANIRDAQPELRTIEFSLDLGNGTYTPLCSVGHDPDEVEKLDLNNLPDDMPEEVKQQLNLLMAKLTGKPN